MSRFNPIRLPLQNKLLANVLQGVLGLNPLITLYDQWLLLSGSKMMAESNKALAFIGHTLDCLHTAYVVENKERLKSIPQKGAVVFCANHPLGGLEGMQLTQLLLECRPDLKVLTNEILTKIPEFSELFIGVDVLSNKSTHKNMSAMKAVSKHLAKGGALLIFPAGTVASVDIRQRKVVEKPWTPMLGGLIRRYQADCMPFYVQGKNSFIFYTFGFLYKRLRTAMLARELSNKKNKVITLKAGSLIHWRDLQNFESDTSITNYLRFSAEALDEVIDNNRNRSEKNKGLLEPVKLINYQSDKDCIEKHLNKNKRFCLQHKGEFSVYCMPFDKLGPLYNELTYTREKTFREVGEGSGNAFDSDHFDPHYEHLFVWDNKFRQIVGAYRIGKGDEILEKFGVEGLYSRSLFNYSENYIQRLGKALELGRSFIAEPYQRNPRALDLLWQGIGAYVTANLNYHTLFGCVSISSDHSQLARAFLSDTMLTRYSAKPEFLTDIRPRSPLKVKGKIWTIKMLESLSSIAVINKLVGNIDPGKSIPVLLRHYLALNGRFVSFTVNHGFNQALDGLILVDLRESPKKYLRRYLGLEGSEKFLQKWNKNEAVA